MTLESELQDLLNKHSAENASNTPDFVLAQFLQGCLDAFNTGVQQRETWYGRDPRPSAPSLSDAVKLARGSDAPPQEKEGYA